MIGRKIVIGVTPNATLLHVKNGFAEVGLLLKSDLTVMRESSSDYIRDIANKMQVGETFSDSLRGDTVVTIKLKEAKR